MSSEFNAKKVSVLIPVYNSQAYISRCLDSIIAQTHSEWEIICIDDGSSDNSPLILDEYCSRYPDKIIVEHRSNEGVAAARNRPSILQLVNIWYLLIMTIGLMSTISKRSLRLP